MKTKFNIIWLISAIVGIVAMAAGVAVIVSKCISDKKERSTYIECECSENKEEE